MQEKIKKIPFLLLARNYLMVTKPGIIFGNSLTAIAGFALASKHHFHPLLLIQMLFGLSMIIASACIFNNWIDRDIDAQMSRTQNRPLPRGVISAENALLLATLLLLFGIIALLFFTNPLTTFVALMGFIVYVLCYSFLKYYSPIATLVGSIAGAIPPVVGYCSVTSRFDLAAFIIFMMVAMWQMPHFFAIALYRIEDYAKVHIPILPLTKGIPHTKWQMLFFSVGFLLCCIALFAFGFSGKAFLLLSSILGGRWIWLSIKGFRSKDDQRWARQMFIFSLIIITSISLIIPIG